jgi:hypothetical protein
VAASVIQVPFELVSLPDSAQGKFSDTLEVDSANRVLYMGDNWSGGTDTFDIGESMPRYTKTTKIRGRIYGLALAPEAGKLFAGVSGSVLAAIMVNTEKSAVEQVHTGGSGHVDLLDYDASHGWIFAANRLDGIITWVDVETNRIVGRVDGLGRGLEQPRYHAADGMVYLTDNVENVLYQIDPAKGRLVETFKISVPCFPNGMAMNPNTNMALLASSNHKEPRTVLWDLARQEISGVFEDCGGADGVVYVPGLDRFLVAASDDAAGPVLGVFGGDPVRLLAKVPTAKGASWAGFDADHGKVYVPAVSNGRPSLLTFALPVT